MLHDEEWLKQILLYVFMIAVPLITALSRQLTCSPICLKKSFLDIKHQQLFVFTLCNSLSTKFTNNILLENLP